MATKLLDKYIEEFEHQGVGDEGHRINRLVQDSESDGDIELDEEDLGYYGYQSIDGDDGFLFEKRLEREINAAVEEYSTASSSPASQSLSPKDDGPDEDGLTLESVLNDFRRGLQLAGVKRKGPIFVPHSWDTKLDRERAHKVVVGKKSQEAMNPMSTICDPNDVIVSQDDPQSFVNMLKTDKWTMKWNGSKCIYIHRESGDTYEAVPSFDVLEAQRVAFQASADCLLERNRPKQHQPQVEGENDGRDDGTSSISSLDLSSVGNEVPSEVVHGRDRWEQAVKQCLSHVDKINSLSSAQSMAGFQWGADPLGVSDSSFILHAGLPMDLWEGNSDT